MGEAQGGGRSFRRPVACRLAEDFSDRFSAGFGQRHRARADHVLFLMIDAQCLIDGCEQLGGTDLTVHDRPAVRVGLAVDRAAVDSRAGERGAPGRCEMVSAQARVDLGSAAKFGQRDYQCALQAGRVP